MSRKEKARRRLRKRALAKEKEGVTQEGAVGRGKDRDRFREGVAILVAAAIVVPVVLFTFLNLYRPDHPDRRLPAPTMAGSAAGPRAAIVDQLSLTQPNRAFVETATELLEQAGYGVEYYPGEGVTVEFYRDLPTRGHELIVFRVHSALGRIGDRPADWVTLFTSDSYRTTWYRRDQTRQRLSRVSYYEDGPQYFGIMPNFIKSSMKGDFQGTTIILMGCDGMRSESIAEAFIQKGARAVVAWDGPVSSTHTDAATERLLHHLLIDGLAIQEAVARTMADVGPDPTYGSTLLAYPSEEPVSAAHSRRPRPAGEVAMR